MIEFIWKNILHGETPLYDEESEDHHIKFIKYIIYGSNAIIYTSLICLGFKLFYIVMLYELQMNLYNNLIYIISLLAMAFNEMIPCIFACGCLIVIGFYLVGIYHAIINKINK